MRELTISLLQFDVRKGNPRSNWMRVQELVSEAARRGAQLAVLPELWEAGAAYEQSQEIASALNGGLFAEMVALARQQRIVIIGSLFEKRGQHVYNTIAVPSPRSGIMGAYRKVHLFPLMGEDKWLARGESPLSLDMPWGRTGFAICYDLRFPELFRRYADNGVELAIVPSEWPHPRLDHYRTLLRARAIENQMFVVVVNRVGTDEGGTQFFGHSCVIDPWGKTVVEAGETESHLTVTIDLDMAVEVRKQMPVLKDRRL